MRWNYVFGVMRVAMSAVQFLIGIMTALVLTAGTPVLAGETALSGVTWFAEDIGGAGVVDNVRSTLSLDETGKVSGSGGCNRLAGTAKIDGTAIAFSALATTRMMCPPAVMDQETKFLSALARARTFSVQDADLKLFDESGAELVRFVRPE